MTERLIAFFQLLEYNRFGEMVKSAKGVVARARTFKGVVRRIIRMEAKLSPLYSVIRWEEETSEA